MKHIYLSRENVPWSRVLSCHINKLPSIRRGYLMALWILRPTSMRGDASLNPAREMTFSSISVRDVYRKPPVSYLSF